MTGNTEEQVGRVVPHRHRAGWRDAVTPRAALLMVGVFVLMLGFAVSYIGALHDPTPYHMDLAVSAPAAQRTQVVRGLNGVAGEPVRARPVGSAATARAEVTDRDADGALVVDGRRARLVVASAGGPALATALERVVRPFAARAGLRLTVTDVRPVAAGDNDGLTSFYLVVAWSVGGYLVASMLGISAGARPASPRRALVRLAAMAVYAVVSGIGGAVVVAPVLHALPGSWTDLWWIGALLVFATAAFTMAAQVVAGVVGIGLAIAIFVILGNPSSGGVFPAPMLPAFWRAIGPWITTGAGTQGVRDIAYFGSAQLTGHLLVIGGYALAGVLVGLAVPAVKGRRRTRDRPAAHRHSS